MRLKFHTLDVFTMERFCGNPLAVVLDADALDTSAMQRITREFNLSETVFVQTTAKPAHTARVRIFSMEANGTHQPLRPGEEARFPYSRKPYVFDYESVSLASGAPLLYQSRLVGWDTDWSPWSTARQLRYSG